VIEKVVLATAAMTLTATSGICAPAVAHADEAGSTEDVSGIGITPEQLTAAISEARDTGRLIGQKTDASGTTTSRLLLARRLTVDVVEPATSKARLGAGSDPYGKYISLNSFDQNAIYTGAGFGLSVGLCAISAGTFCIVAGAIVAAAGLAVSTNGGQCASNKTLRVYPFSGHKPRCV